MNKIPVLSLTCALAALLMLTGCRQPDQYPDFGNISNPAAAALLGQHHIVGSSVNNTPIMAQVFGQGDSVTLIIGGIHGNEPAGTPLVKKLAQYIRLYPELANGRTIVLLPNVNPDGMAKGTRYNANNVDLNRNFAAPNRVNTATTGHSALSEPESRVIERLIRQYAPDRIVATHQPLACIDYDGPARGIAASMQRYCDLTVKKLGARPGSLGAYAGEKLGIPTITFEMKQHDSQLSGDEIWRKYGKALLAAITYPNPP
ncbi:MAG: DUF2817 domain-containing protein [Sedimentisphaerales bacterium]|nr:DUF2817 domain-containing protein [Sedimentisphaerales bacterium]